MNNQTDTNLIVDLLNEKKAEKIEVYDVTGKVSYTDFVIICESDNKLHNKAIADHVIKKTKGIFKSLGKEGISDGDWILVDLGEIIIHLFTYEKREKYNLEELLTKKINKDQ